MLDLHNSVILCSTARLARSLRILHGRRQQAAGLRQWQPLPALTLEQWLAERTTQALLQGDIAMNQVPRMVLNKGQEIALWQRIIERMLSGDAVALFDSNGLAKAAMEANQLMQEWNIALPALNDGAGHAEELANFMQWRHEFRQLCQEHAWMDASRYCDWQIAHLASDRTTLPACIYMAGYDRTSLQEQRLLDVLQQRGVQVLRWSHACWITAEAAPMVAAGMAADAARTQQVGLADCEAECRAAVAWAAAKLSANPQARLAIVVPELANLRACLTALLDDALHPLSLSPAHAAMTRSYDLSLGEPLARQPLVACALSLLRLHSQRYALNQQDVTRLLLNPYWSASQAEADARAQLDARMRAHLPLTLSLDRLLRFLNKQHRLALPALHAALSALLQAPAIAADARASAKTAARQLPSWWAQYFSGLLQQAQWPGERGLSSHEYQAQQAFSKALTALAGFDVICGSVSLAQAVQRLGQLCNEQIFQPESQDDPPLLVMGMLETVAAPLDAMWVMGMNDHVWPPAPRPNPLLPARLQRMARAPNADGPVQAEFAQAIHQRLLTSAREIMFSWAHKSGESELRISPLMQNVPHYAASLLPLPLATTLGEQLSLSRLPRQWLDDFQAPSVSDRETVSGGAGILRAQAICPAWAYYRYRLGARPLEVPVDGLDSMERGNLVHAVLQCFWQGRDSEYLHALDDDGLRNAIVRAVEAGVAQFSSACEEPLPANFLLLEKQRLHFLLAVWLAYEKERPPFSVDQCEERRSVQIAGLNINLTLDRVDKLADGRLVVIDYKTGASVSHHSWAQARISEPQLPIYSALALAQADIAAVCFAQVRADTQRFVGVAAEAELLPGIKELAEVTRIFPPDSFPDWIALMRHWKTSIEAIADELMAGMAAVAVSHESELAYCEVLPILRLPERYLQLEAASAINVNPNSAQPGLSQSSLNQPRLAPDQGHMP